MSVYFIYYLHDLPGYIPTFLFMLVRPLRKKPSAALSVAIASNIVGLMNLLIPLNSILNADKGIPIPMPSNLYSFKKEKISEFTDNMKLPERIIIDEKICAGKLCIRGTRLSVEFILELTRRI
ncbi:MAG: DUF433 domain-containing protein [Promethearchaeia archaeon]